MELSQGSLTNKVYFTTTATPQTLMINETFITPFFEYSFRIAAFTNVGTGPFSSRISKRTPEDGKMIIMIY